MSLVLVNVFTSGAKFISFNYKIFAGLRDIPEILTPFVSSSVKYSSGAATMALHSSSVNSRLSILAQCANAWFSSSIKLFLSFNARLVIALSKIQQYWLLFHVYLIFVIIPKSLVVMVLPLSSGNSPRGNGMRLPSLSRT